VRDLRGKAPGGANGHAIGAGHAVQTGTGEDQTQAHAPSAPRSPFAPNAAFSPFPPRKHKTSAQQPTTRCYRNRSLLLWK